MIILIEMKDGTQHFIEPKYSQEFVKDFPDLPDNDIFMLPVWNGKNSVNKPFLLSEIESIHNFQYTGTLKQKEPLI